MKQTPEKMFAIAAVNVDLAEKLYRQQEEPEPLVSAACYFALSLEVARQRLCEACGNDAAKYSQALATIEEATKFAAERFLLLSTAEGRAAAAEFTERG